jgi:ABC-type lipoprotein export system ATPase subunit
MLTATKLSKQYSRPTGDVQALCDVSLEIKAGEFVAVQGPSGCGKTTLLLVCGALLAPDSGTLTVNNINPYAISSEEQALLRAQSIGFVFQQFHLIPYLSVRDNVLAAALAWRTPGVEERADALIAQFGLAERAAHVPSELSVGERQRVALARALLNQPKLILADEPTGNLDEASGKTVLSALAEYARNDGAVLMVTHDPRASAMAHHVLAMRSGRLY